ncbi:uncharacterized protein LOC143270128 isoform X3 [Peromyscus maniculatus bairdii]|uniref:uncharacterized protein LOC143270128 isoform X3 n=1 Tax=Peromyscus maniculatus bairdii TaxID=230844 RepID=UPI003FD3957C
MSLQYAWAHNHPDMVTLLLSKKASIDIQDDEGYTPLIKKREEQIVSGSRFSTVKTIPCVMDLSSLDEKVLGDLCERQSWDSQMGHYIPEENHCFHGHPRRLWIPRNCCFRWLSVKMLVTQQFCSYPEELQSEVKC